MPRPPPLSALRVFEAAARHGSFLRAASELHVTPAAVSHHIQPPYKDARTAIGRAIVPPVPIGNPIRLAIRLESVDAHG